MNMVHDIQGERRNSFTTLLPCILFVAVVNVVTVYSALSVSASS